MRTDSKRSFAHGLGWFESVDKVNGPERREKTSDAHSQETLLDHGGTKTGVHDEVEGDAEAKMQGNAGVLDDASSSHVSGQPADGPLNKSLISIGPSAPPKQDAFAKPTSDPNPYSNQPYSNQLSNKASSKVISSKQSRLPSNLERSRTRSMSRRSSDVMS